MGGYRTVKSAASVKDRDSFSPDYRSFMGVPLVGTVILFKVLTPRRRVVSGVQHFGKGHLGSNEL
jgi:hypothetical protein